MRQARAFFFVCAGLFLLALAYHFGATTATAQAPGNPVVGFVMTDNGAACQVITANGDIYTSANNTPYHYWGNVFGGSPTPAQSISIGQLKARYATPAGRP